MPIVFVMDPLSKVHPEKDTTFALIRSAHEAGHEAFHTELHNLSIDKGTVWAECSPVMTSSNPNQITFTGPPRPVDLADVTAVFIRKDPPFDRAYFYATLLLEPLRGKTLVLNDPRGLREANEKLYALNFAQWMPETMVTAERARIEAFTARVGGSSVIKPLDGAGGVGVMMLRQGDRNVRSIIDHLTAEGRRLVMVQQYIPAVEAGDKRILLLDGQVLGAILRVPRGDDLRSNIHVGGTVVQTDLSPKEKEMVAAIAPRLQADGLYFVGLDVIGEQLTEVNVTSPTGIRELDAFTGTANADRVISWIDAKAAAMG